MTAHTPWQKLPLGFQLRFTLPVITSYGFYSQCEWKPMPPSRRVHRNPRFREAYDTVRKAFAQAHGCDGVAGSHHPFVEPVASARAPSDAAA